ncbi:MAG: hypothetical protein IKF90_11990 [Parasporobacterium sp.]|nr:hypothetical protein [Parasporobacterium sp.]
MINLILRETISGDHENLYMQIKRNRGKMKTSEQFKNDITEEEKSKSKEEVDAGIKDFCEEIRESSR